MNEEWYIGGERGKAAAERSASEMAQVAEREKDEGMWYHNSAEWQTA